MSASVSQELKMVIKAEVSDAMKKMKDFKKGVKGATDALEKIPPQIVGKDFIGPLPEASKRVGAFRLSIANLGKQMKGLQSMNKMTVFSISNLVQTFSLARQGGNMTKYVFGQVMDQMALMGPKGLLIGGAVAGLGFLSQKFGMVKTEAKKAVDPIIQLNDVVKTYIGTDYQTATSIVAELEKQIQDFGKTSIEVKKELAAQTITLSEIELAAMQDQFSFQKQILDDYELQAQQARKAADEMWAKVQEAAESDPTGRRAASMARDLDHMQNVAHKAQKRFEDFKDGQDTLRVSIKLAGDALDTQKKAFAEIEPLQAKARAQTKALADEKKRVAELEGADSEAGFELREAFKQMDEARAEELQRIKEFKRKQKQLDRKAAQEKKQLLMQQIAEEKAIASTAMGFSIGLLQQGADAMIRDEENLMQRLGVMFLKRTGNMLVTDGQARVLMGIAANATVPGTGTGAIAAGATEIAAGIAMGAGATAISQSISTKKRNESESRRGATDSGSAGGVRSGGSFGGKTTSAQQSTVINISYGIGPQPEQTAQAVLDAMAFGNRRGMRGRA